MIKSKMQDIALLIQVMSASKDVNQHRDWLVGKLSKGWPLCTPSETGVAWLGCLETAQLLSAFPWRWIMPFEPRGTFERFRNRITLQGVIGSASRLIFAVKICTVFGLWERTGVAVDGWCKEAATNGGSLEAARKGDITGAAVKRESAEAARRQGMKAPRGLQRE